ncbi:5-oxoprolinase subunit PxpB [Chitinibacteraceae bacterium HSL-7]
MSDEVLSIQPLGERALVLNVGAGLPMQRRLWATWHALSDRLPQVEWVLGFGNLTGVFDPLVTPMRLVEKALEGGWQHSAGAEFEAGRLHEIPVLYGAEDGPDLDDVARYCELSTAEVIARHTAPDYLVYCLGFLPGFAYLGGLDTTLATPRKSVPRERVVAGAVGIGGEQTGIYPLDSPGGWQIIGRTDVQLVDAYRKEPVLFAPGDVVRLVAL